MSTRKIVGILAAWLVMLGLAGLWHNVIMADYYASYLQAVARAEPDFLMIGNGYLALAILMGWAYPHGYSGGSPAAEGARFGAAIGLLWILPFSLVLSGLYDLSIAQVAVDSAWHIAEGAAGGTVVALGYSGTGRPPAES